MGQGIVPQVAWPLNSFPDDTVQYNQLKEAFRATGGEQYITLGNFYSMSATLFKNLQTGNIVSTSISDTINRILTNMFIDDLSLIKVPPPDSLLTSSKDTVLCPGDTLWLQAYTADTASGVLWDDSSTANLRPITTPGTYWVQLRCGCDLTLTDTVTVRPHGGIPPLSVRDTTICQGQKANYSLPNSLVYTLNGSPTPPAFELADSGQYLLQASNGCFSADYPFAIGYKDVEPLPNLVINDTALCESQSAQYALPQGYNYTLNVVAVSGRITLSEQGSYELVVDNTCESQSYAFEVNDEGCKTLIFVPNAFTPDEDGLNDCFKVSVVQQERYHISIFNRWGQMVYEGHNPDECWDGSFKGQPVFGGFTYAIAVKTGARTIKKYGKVTVLR